MTYIIQGDASVYLVQEKRRWKRSTPPHLTANMPVKFAVSERGVLFRGDDGMKYYKTQWSTFLVTDGCGREHEMEVVRRVRLEPAEPSKRHE